MLLGVATLEGVVDAPTAALGLDEDPDQTSAGA
jgi:hypothetical protein